MKLSRRSFFIAASVSAISIAMYRLFGGVSRQTKPEDLLMTVLPEFLDTLIPADQTPSASQLNVDEDMLDYLADRPRHQDIVLFGCMWLNKQSNELFDSDFGKLNTQQKIQIVENLESIQQNQTAQFFFYHVKEKAFEFYYSKPQSWVGLGFYQPPQPLGYADYNQSPIQTS